MIRKLLPHPIGSATLALFWLWLNNTLDPGHVVLGLLVGWALPLFTRRFWPEQERVARAWRLVPFAGVVLADIVTANLRVARAVLGPVGRLSPGFARVPLDLRSDVGIAVLANTISLTPGTLSADLTEDRRHLVVHYLDERDPQAMVADIKRRYERRLQEVFG